MTMFEYHTACSDGRFHTINSIDDPTAAEELKVGFDRAAAAAHQLNVQLDARCSPHRVVKIELAQ